MNQPIQSVNSQAMSDDDAIDLATIIDTLFDHRWLIASVALVVTMLGVAYAIMAKPVYQANILIQVEDSPNSSKNILGDLSSMFDVKAMATSEIEILRSRMVVSRAVDNLVLNVEAKPKHFPMVGGWFALRNKELSNPGLFGWEGYAWGAEKIVVGVFNVPDDLREIPFVVTAGADGQFSLRDKAGNSWLGVVGKTLEAQTGDGKVELRIDSLAGKPGAQFSLRGSSRLEAIKRLQDDMVIKEKGKQSGMIEVTLEGRDPALTSRILNEIAQEYVRQNVDRKSAEAEKSLIFLEKQLPELKRELEHSEASFNKFRNSSGTIDLGEEAKQLLQQSVAMQVKLVELKQKRQELLIRYTNEHPAVVGLNNQIKDINGELQGIAGRIKKLPLIEQDLLRLTRDVKVNTDLYTALLNTSQQLRLVKAGKVGSVRLIDQAMVPEKPVKPKKLLVVAIAMLLGVMLGVVAAFIRNQLYGGVNDAHEIEQALGLTVYANIPHSKQQDELFLKVLAKAQQTSVLAQIDPTDPAIESLRSFRTSLQFSMLDAENNVVLITGPAPGLGKSFVSVNLAAVLAAAGKKVLLVDADLRKGYLHQYFGLERENGLSDLAAGLSTLEQVLHKNVLENVDFIATGSLPPNPSELLLHENVVALLKQRLSSSYDYVILDTPPVLAVSDTLNLGPHAGALFLVARAGQSSLGEIKESVKRCSHTGIPVKGVILNDIKYRPGNYGYGYKYGRYRYAQYKY